MFRRTALVLVALALAMGLSSRADAREVALDDFSRRIQVTIPDSVADVAALPPILVRIDPTTSADFSVEQFARSDKSDFVVYDCGATATNVLPSEVDSFTTDESGEVNGFLLWVNPATIQNNNHNFYIYFGCNDQISGETITITPTATAVWSGYAGVWHMSEAATADTAAATTVKDSAGNGLTATPSNGGGGGSVGEMVSIPGPVGNARVNAASAVNKGNYLKVEDSTVLDFGNTLTASGWFKATGANNTMRLISRKTGTTTTTGFEIYATSGKTDSFVGIGSSAANTSTTRSLTATVPDLVEGWVYITMVYNNRDFSMYTNGVLAGSTTVSTTYVVKDNNFAFGIGNGGTGALYSFFGSYDEVRLYKSAATADYIANDYKSMRGELVKECGRSELTDTTIPSFLGLPSVVYTNYNNKFIVSANMVSGTLKDNTATVTFANGGTKLPFTLTTSDTELPYAFSGDVPVASLAANTVYSVLVSTVNQKGSVGESAITAAYSGCPTIAKIADASEVGLVPGSFKISLPSATPADLVVNYKTSGSAESGTNYAALSGSVTIPAGESSATVVVRPKLDTVKNYETMLQVDIIAGDQYVYTPGQNATMKIANRELDPYAQGKKIWLAEEDSDHLASTGDNWSGGTPPTAEDEILLSGDFSKVDCTWDAAATHKVASWEQSHSYTGTVTFCNSFRSDGGFPKFEIAGDAIVDAGAWTHPISINLNNLGTKITSLEDFRAKAQYRLYVSASTFTLGASAAIDVIGKGHSQLRLTGNVVTWLPSHGGWHDGSALSAYGDPKAPTDVGSAGNIGTDALSKSSAGAGAVHLEVTGACVINGTITADSSPSPVGMSSGSLAASAGGSIWITADSVTGAGSITANGVYSGNNGQWNGVGGRIALVTRAPVNLSALTVTAGSHVNGKASASGTVFLKDSTTPNGILRVENVTPEAPAYRDIVNASKLRYTPVTADGDWTFDKIVLNSNVQLMTRPDTTLKIVGGLKNVTAPDNAGRYSGLYYGGGTLDLRDAEGNEVDQIIAGNWYFAPITKYTFEKNVTVKEGAAIGFSTYYDQTLANKASPDTAQKIRFAVNGDLTVEEGAVITGTGAGAMQESSQVPAGISIGVYGGTWSVGQKNMDSVFDPQFAGIGQNNSYGWNKPGAALEMSVAGHFKLDGSVNTVGNDSQSGLTYAGVPGSISIRAGSISGKGSVKAHAAAGRQQAGGRIAIRLTDAGATFDEFYTGKNILAYNLASSSRHTGPGSIYLQEGTDKELYGEIVFDSFITNITGSTFMSTNFTPVCATGYRPDDMTNDFNRASLTVIRGARAALPAKGDGKFRMLVLKVGTGAADFAQLDLNGMRFTVNEAFLGAAKLPQGVYSYDVDPGDAFYLGRYLSGPKSVPWVVDNSSEKTGQLIIKGNGTFIRLR